MSIEVLVIVEPMGGEHQVVSKCKGRLVAWYFGEVVVGKRGDAKLFHVFMILFHCDVTKPVEEFPDYFTSPQ
jgi:hypothetical protein